MLSSWIGNLQRLIGGRPTWDANREFDFYRVTADRVREHRERQGAFANEAHATGLSLMRAMGILDVDWLAQRDVLEIGAGECLLAEAIAFAGQAREVWALEATPKQIWAAAERYGADKKLHFVIGDAQDSPFEDGSFDVIVANLVLHHIHPLDRLLSEVHRVLRPGGLFVAFEPNPILGPLVHAASSDNEAPISPSFIRAALARAGLAHDATDYWWVRGGTSGLRLLSPGFRVRATKAGASQDSTRNKTRRKLASTGLPGLLVDEQCHFINLVNEQVTELQKLLKQSN